MIKVIVVSIIVLFLCLFSSTCFAGRINTGSPSDKYPVGGGRILTAEECAWNEAHGIYAIGDPRRPPQTADEIAEGRFADQNMIVNEQGDCEVRPKATGQRQVISSRLAVNENGQLEAIPTNGELEQQKTKLEEIREHNQKAFEEAGLRLKGDPEAKKSEEARQAIKDMQDSGVASWQAQIDQWERDKSGETPIYNYKAFVSYEKGR